MDTTTDLAGLRWEIPDEFPDRETTYMVNCSRGHKSQGPGEKFGEINLHIVGADVEMFRELGEQMKKTRRRRKADGGKLEYLLEFKSYEEEPI